MKPVRVSSKEGAGAGEGTSGAGHLSSEQWIDLFSCSRLSSLQSFFFFFLSFALLPWTAFTRYFRLKYIYGKLKSGSWKETGGNETGVTVSRQQGLSMWHIPDRIEWASWKDCHLGLMPALTLIPFAGGSQQEHLFTTDLVHEWHNPTTWHSGF